MPGAAPPPQPKLPPFKVAQLPGADALTPDERALCEHLRLAPQQYAQIKASVVNVALVRGLVRRGRDTVQVDVAKIAGVYDFVVTAGPAKGDLGEGAGAGEQRS